VYPGDDRHPRVEFASELEVDLSRRDFTVNAMAVRLPEREFVDPFGGLKDLAAKRLETPLEPEVSFGDDPLRMLRAARFASSLELAPTPRVVAAMRSMVPRLEIVSAERVRDELSKLLLSPKPLLGLNLAVETGLAERVLAGSPALSRYVRDAGPPLDRLNQLVRADCTTRNVDKAKALAALQDDLELRIARLAEQENLQAIRPPLDGDEVMAHLGIPPGPKVGRAL